MQNAIPTPCLTERANGDAVAERVASRSAGEARRGLQRRGPAAARRRARGDARGAAPRRGPGSPTSSRPPGCRTTPSTGTSRPRTRSSRPSSRTAPSGCGSYLAHQMAKEADARGQGPPLGRGRAGPGGRRRHRRDHPRRALERRQPGRAASPPGRPFATAPLATLLREPFADLGSADPELDASLAAHATVGMLADWLWKRVRPTPADDRSRRRVLPRRSRLGHGLVRLWAPAARTRAAAPPRLRHRR